LVEFERPVVQVVVGDEFWCALLEGGTVRCWGRGGVLGSGNTEAIAVEDAARLARDLTLR
jgi:hypothetical protein